MKSKKWMLLLVGFVSLGLGCVGIALPILPTVPLFCFTNSSQRLHDWFLGTRLYKKHWIPMSEKRA